MWMPDNELGEHEMAGIDPGRPGVKNMREVRHPARDHPCIKLVRREHGITRLSSRRRTCGPSLRSGRASIALVRLRQKLARFARVAHEGAGRGKGEDASVREGAGTQPTAKAVSCISKLFCDVPKS